MQRRLDNWLKSYLQYTAYNEAPDIFHFWAGVGAISGALRRKVFFDQTYYRWAPNFYIILVAPPGIATKSTALGISEGILSEVDGIKFGPNAITWPALTASMAACRESVLMPDGLYHPMSALIFYSSELGSLLDPQDRKMLDILVDLWDGKQGVWKKDTKTCGSDSIENPWLTIVAGTTPPWLADNLPRTLIYGGFTSRCVFVFADTKRQLVPYPRDLMPPEMAKLRDDLLHDLALISTMCGEYQLTKEAREFGVQWYTEHNEKITKLYSEDMGMSGYFSRKQGHAHKLAMILAAAQSSKLIITRRNLEEAVLVLNAVEKDLPRVFRALRTAPAMEQLDHIIGLVKSLGSVSREEVYRHYMHMMSDKDFNALIASGVTGGALRLRQVGTTVLLEPTSPGLV